MYYYIYYIYLYNKKYRLLTRYMIFSNCMVAEVLSKIKKFIPLLEDFEKQFKKSKITSKN